MTDIEGPERKLVRLLDSLPPQDRIDITTWLLSRPPTPSPPWTTGPAAALRRVSGSTLAVSGETSQLVTIRLPAQQHERLRDWCAEHNFTMAAVVRGLVERFLEDQGVMPGQVG
jgi:hypothetical protein